MDFLRKFIKRVLCIIGAMILANPLSFLGVTGFFTIAVYMCWRESGEVNFNIEECIALMLVYIIALSVFMENEVAKFHKKDNKSGNKVEIKQNYISLFNFFKNTKK